MKLVQFLNEIQILTELNRKFKPEFIRQFQGSKVVGRSGNPEMMFHGTHSPEEIQEFYPLSHFGSLKSAEQVVKDKSGSRISSIVAQRTKEFGKQLEQELAKNIALSSNEKYEHLTSARLEFGHKLRNQLKSELQGYSEGARIIPVYLDIKNPLKMKDQGHSHTSHNWLSDIGEELKIPWSEQEQLSNLVGEVGDKFRKDHPESDHKGEFYLWYQQIDGAKKQVISEYLKQKGYDGIVYVNRVEGKGTESWVPFDNSQIIPATEAFISESVMEEVLNELHLPKSPEFYQWFKGSKVVDEQGNPQPVFHGTKSWAEFDKPHAWSHFGTTKAANDRVMGDPTQEVSKRMQALHGKDNINPYRIMPYYLRITNPLMVKDPDDQHDEEIWMSVLWRTGEFENLRALEKAATRGEDEFYRATADFLSRRGYDGIVYKNTLEDPGSLTWVPFRDDQIKTAFTESFRA